MRTGIYICMCVCVCVYVYIVKDNAIEERWVGGGPVFIIISVEKGCLPSLAQNGHHEKKFTSITLGVMHPLD